MTIDEKIKREKFQHGLKRELAKISDLSSSDIDRHEYLKSKEILPPEQKRTTDKLNLSKKKKKHLKTSKSYQKERRKTNKSLKSLDFHKITNEFKIKIKIHLLQSG